MYIHAIAASMSIFVVRWWVSGFFGCRALGVGGFSSSDRSFVSWSEFYVHTYNRRFRGFGELAGEALGFGCWLALRSLGPR
ncbi:hypothetical protein FPQ18DRAFT_361906 [Pyronema domesticum]|nr:hypothetical protein FPQ18DRAFT_361906 [Pyronema domesticum]